MFLILIFVQNILFKFKFPSPRFLKNIIFLQENKLLESDLETRRKWQEADDREHQEVTASVDILERTRRDLSSAYVFLFSIVQINYLRKFIMLYRNSSSRFFIL